MKDIEKALQNITGRDFIKAERMARQQGDQTPVIALSTTFQIILAANVLNVPQDEIENLPVSEFVQVLAKVNGFLFGAEQIRTRNKTGCYRVQSKHVYRDRFLS